MATRRSELDDVVKLTSKTEPGFRRGMSENSPNSCDCFPPRNYSFGVLPDNTFRTSATESGKIFDDFSDVRENS